LNITAEQAAAGLAIGRCIAGAGTWLAPSLACRALGTDAEAHPPLPMVLRLFGTRDAAMGAAYLAADVQQRRNWLMLGVAVDAADAAGALLAGERSGLPTRTRMGIAVTALSAVAIGLWARGALSD
jgi:hypothetical protein